MRKCNTCQQDFDDSLFDKPNGNHFKLCPQCREKGRIQNNRRKAAKSAQAKEYYQQYKDEVSKRNKEYREKNKEKLRQYEKSDQRKQKNKQWRENKRTEDRFRFIWYAAKRRAHDNGIPFAISKQDIIDIFPSDGKCPMLGITLQFNNKQSQDDSPSLDRIVPELGYVPGNILLLSYRANRIKNDATLEELKKIVCFLEDRKQK